MSELPEYRIDRVFDASPDLVWRAWTEPRLLNRWYGPNVETIIHGFDLKPGGTWLNEMKWGDKSNFSKMLFQEVIQPEKLVWHHHSCTDSDWSDIANPMMPNWPRVLLTTVTFEAMGEKTNVRLTQVPLEATDEEIACFAESMSGMDKGWGSGYEILETIVAELKAGGA